MSLWCVRMVKQCAVAYKQGPLNLPFRCLDSWICNMYHQFTTATLLIISSDKEHGEDG